MPIFKDIKIEKLGQRLIIGIIRIGLMNQLILILKKEQLF